MTTLPRPKCNGTGRRERLLGEQSTVSAYEMVLPFPSRVLSPNSRQGWRAKAAAVKEYRWQCNILAREARPRGEPVSALSITFVVADNRKRDLDNLIASFKSGMDGLRDAGVIADDNWQTLKVTYAVERGSEFAVKVVL